MTEENLQGVSPEKSQVLKIFEEISMIPRPSGYEERIGNYLLEQGRSLGFFSKKDRFGNVIIEVPAGPGFENGPLIILQAHMDMVCVSKKSYTYNMLLDPIKLKYIDGWLTADSTSLGADDGIGLAMILAYVKEHSDHSRLRLIFTVQEETGMDGAQNIESKYLDADYMINLDSEEEGYVTCACAGGCEGSFSLPIERTNPDKTPDNIKFAQIFLYGLRGGHSGMQIMEVNTNAIKIMAEFLRKIDEQIVIDLYSLDGGDKQNAIPNHAQALISYPAESEGQLLDVMNSVRDGIMGSLLKSDPDAHFVWEGHEEANVLPLSPPSKQKLLSLIEMVPHGVYTMRSEGEGVESSNNLAIIKSENSSFNFVISVRSGDKHAFEELKAKISSSFELFGGNGVYEKGYPIWEMRGYSELKDIFLKIYEQESGKEARILDIHAGLECAFFAEKNPDLDMISLGPDTEGAHTVEERVNLGSCERTYKLLEELAKEISLKRSERL